MTGPCHARVPDAFPPIDMSYASAKMVNDVVSSEQSDVGNAASAEPVHLRLSRRLAVFEGAEALNRLGVST